MSTKLKSILVITILVLAGFVMIWNFGSEKTNVQAADLYVGSDSTYKTIQAAVSAAGSGDTIYVKNGTYYESVTISTSNIELVGNSTTDCKIIHYFTGTSYSNYAAGINVTNTGSGSKISGFNISVSGDYTYGIFLDNTNNIEIFNNNITTNGDNYSPGVLLYASTNNIVKSNDFITSGSYSSGVHLRVSSTVNEIIDNDMVTSGSAGHGVYMETGCKNNDVIGNTMYTSGMGNGIYISSSPGSWDNNKLYNNTINCIGDIGIGLSNTFNNTLINNTININGTDGGGIYLYQSSYNNLTENILNCEGTNGFGIYLSVNSNSNDLVDNTITTLNQSGYGTSGPHIPPISSTGAIPTASSPKGAVLRGTPPRSARAHRRCLPKPVGC